MNTLWALFLRSGALRGCLGGICKEGDTKEGIRWRCQRRLKVRSPTECHSCARALDQTRIRSRATEVNAANTYCLSAHAFLSTTQSSTEIRAPRLSWAYPPKNYFEFAVEWSQRYPLGTQRLRLLSMFSLTSIYPLGQQILIRPLQTRLPSETLVSRAEGDEPPRQHYMSERVGLLFFKME